MNKAVHFLTPDDLHWPLGRQESTPEYSIGAGKYPRAIKVDPYPAYPHDPERVSTILDHCMDVFPLPCHKFGLWILSHDLIDRVNGITYEDPLWNKEDGSEWDDQILCYCGCGEKVKMYGQAISIALAAKRIPIMPSMTRYLVSHEYGHAAFYSVARLMGYKDHEKEKLEETYMEMRGIEDYAKKYNGGEWHRSPGEIIANDFRVLFPKQEIEFWPHDCELPSWNQPEGKWWKMAAEICGVKVK